MFYHFLINIHSNTLRIFIIIGFTFLAAQLFAQSTEQIVVERKINLSIQSKSNSISPNFTFAFDKQPAANINRFNEWNRTNYILLSNIKTQPLQNLLQPNLILPAYTQGKFCDFEDYINRNNKMRIDFGVQ